MTDDVTRDLVLPMSELGTIDEAAALARDAEGLGYAQLTTGETTGRNVLPVLAVLAERTDSIGLSEHVLSPWSRSPALLGQSAVTLAELSDGRFRLGLGASSPPLAERWHATAFDRPLRRLRECIEIVRLVQSGDSVDYDGAIYEMGGLSLECSPPDESVPVDVSALGPTATELAGRFGDGWTPQLLPLDGLEDRLDDLGRGAELGDRSVDDVRVAPTVRCCVTEDGDRARRYASMHVAFMVARYGPYYREAVADGGWPEVAEAVVDAWDEGGMATAAEQVPRELLDDLVAAGTAEEARASLERFEAVDGVDATQVGFVGRLSEEDRARTLEALAPDGAV